VEVAAAAEPAEAGKWVIQLKTENQKDTYKNMLMKLRLE
jgi:hypothetical protein